MRFERIHIELTNRCNFSCEFCPETIMKREQGDMEFSLLTKTLDEISERQLAETVLFHVMGEPLLYSELVAAVQYARDKGLEVCITTNGSLMTDAILERLLGAGVDHIIFSVQTPHAESFKLRKANMDFNQYLERITSIVARILDGETDTKITLSFLVTPYRSVLLPSNKISIIDSRKDLHGHLLFWIKEVASKESKNGKLIKINDRLEELENRIKKLGMLGWNQLKITDTFMLETRVLGDWIHPGLNTDRIKRAHFGSCEGLTEHFGILWNGDCVFCCVDFDGKTAFGNVNSENITDVLRKPEVQRVIENFKSSRVIHPYCQRCLGDASLSRSLARQFGSVLYFKFYRPFWRSKRARALPIIK